MLSFLIISNACPLSLLFLILLISFSPSPTLYLLHLPFRRLPYFPIFPQSIPFSFSNTFGEDPGFYNGVVANVLDGDIIGRDYEFPSRCYIHFWTNTLEKGMNTPKLLFFCNDGFGIKWPTKVDMPLKQQKKNQNNTFVFFQASSKIH